MQNKKIIRVCVWILFIAYLFSFLLTTSNDFSQDLGRHLKLGEIITQTKTVPKINLFSYTYPNFSFINHHWFSEVVFFLSQKWLGINSLIILKACVICLAIVIAVASSSSIWGVGVGFLLSPLILERADIRPEIFGFLFFSLIFMQLKKVKREKQISPFLPIIFLLWVNIHISFIFGLLLLGILFLSADKNKKNISVIVLSLMCLFINPNGIRGVLAPFTIFSNYGYSIVENQNMFFLFNRTYDIFIRGYFLLLPIIFVSIYALCRQKKYIETFLLTLFAAAALYQVRHLPFFVLTALFILPDLLKNIHIRLSQTVKSLTEYMFIILLLCGIIFFGSGLFFETFDINKSFGFGFELVDKKVITYLQKNPQKGNIFNNFDIGSYLSFGLYPKNKVFVDGRPEAYPASFFKNIYIPIEEDQSQQEKYFTRYNIHTIVVSHTDQTPWGQIFLARITHDNKWKLVYLDSVCAVFTDAEKEIDMRAANDFTQQTEEETDFFKLAQYAQFFDVTDDKKQTLFLLKKMNMLRPHSCTLIRLYKMQNDAPWCF